MSASSIDPSVRDRARVDRRASLDGLVAVAATGVDVSSSIATFASRIAVDECNRCPLIKSATPVPWSGPASSIMIVGEAPGAEEDRLGVPFVGRSGAILDEMLERAELPREKVAVANTIGCRPPRNNYEFAREVGAPDACRPHLEAAMEASHAWIVISAGGQAAREFGHMGSVGSAVGAWRWKGGRLHTTIWHPAYVLRQGGMSSPEATRNIGVLNTAAITASGIDRYVPAAPYDTNILSSLGRSDDADNRAKIAEALRRNGWVPIHSRVLDRDMIVYDAARHRVGEFKVPPGMADPVYLSVDELARLRSYDDVRRIAAFKDVMPEARVVG